jgi:hypothetical protein
MIIVGLGGGLGNQMFQYALGKKLSIKNHDTLLLDMSAFDNDLNHKDYRPYGLAHFNITASPASLAQIQKAKHPYGKIVSKFKNRAIRIFDPNPNTAKFNPAMLRKKGDIYLEGFWQSYKYFDGIRQELLKEFSLNHPLSSAAQEIAETIKKSPNSVSLHIRRGDYVENPEITKSFGTYCDRHYYQRALEHLAAKRGDLSVFVFSDDIAWVKEHMPFPHQTMYVSGKDIPDHEYLALMSLCQDHIIANSTFSWWGAWLDDKADKIVIGPKIWVPTGRLPIDDIMPPEWIRV